MLKQFTLGSIAFMLLINHLSGFTEVRAAQLKDLHPAPGEMVDIGGYRLHIDCQGEGEVAVILEAGLGNPGLAWALVQPEVAKYARVCMYDRAGLGWSDPSPRQRTAKEIVHELHTLLDQAEIDGPYVLVGHSFGGLLMRMYAYMYPEQVVGLVLVDSYRFTQIEKYPQVNGKGNVLIPLSLRLLNLWVASGIPVMAPSLVPALDLGKLPPGTLKTYRDLVVSDPKSAQEAQQELSMLEESSRQERDANITSLGDIPLIVLTHGYLEPRPLDPISTEDHKEYERFWRADQAELAALSVQGRMIITAKSGHYVQLDEPELVIEAIEEVLAQAQP